MLGGTSRRARNTDGKYHGSQHQTNRQQPPEQPTLCAHRYSLPHEAVYRTLSPPTRRRTGSGPYRRAEIETTLSPSTQGQKFTRPGQTPLQPHTERQGRPCGLHAAAALFAYGAVASGLPLSVRRSNTGAGGLKPDQLLGTAASPLTGSVLFVPRSSPGRAIAFTTHHALAALGTALSDRPRTRSRCRRRPDDCISSGGLNAAPAQSRRFASLVPHLEGLARRESARCWAAGAAIPRRWAAPRSPRSKREGPGVVERVLGRTVLAGDRACGGRIPR